MSIREITMYAVACDTCGKQAQYGDYAAWGDKDSAVDMACSRGFETCDDYLDAGDGKHYCTQHYCHECDKPERPKCPQGCPERDWMCASCCDLDHGALP